MIRPFVRCGYSTVDRGRRVVGSGRTVAAALAGAVARAAAGVRLCLQGILFVLYNDIAWQLLPMELGFGSGQTCWRRLDRWQKAGVFDRLHRVLLTELNAAANSTGHVRAWTAPTFARKRGTRHRSVAGRPAENGQQTPPDLRRTRHRLCCAIRCGGEGGSAMIVPEVASSVVRPWRR
ncbi:transposase [Streptomyces kaempferi]